MKPTLSLGRLTLALVHPPESMPYYEGTSGALKLKISKLPWDKWNGFVTLPGGSMIKTLEFPTATEAGQALIARAKEFNSELTDLLGKID